MTEVLFALMISFGSLDSDYPAVPFPLVPKWFATIEDCEQMKEFYEPSIPRFADKLSLRWDYYSLKCHRYEFKFDQTISDEPSDEMA